MPGPFPGMDPYLETPRFWYGFHNGLIFNIQAILNAELPEGFAANYEERVLIIPPEHSMRPDVLIKESLPPSSPAKTGGATAVVDAGAPHGVIIAYPDEIREGFIEIRTADEAERVIAVIEVLSPTNKYAGGVGREEYLRKQRQLLQSATHLMEIDLLRGGEHTVAAPREGLRQRGKWDYLVCLHRSTQRYHFAYWFNTLRERLPFVRVPLTEDIPDVVLDLQVAFDRAYDAGPYRRLIDYRKEPPIPLNEEEAAWADALLREKGLRP